MQNHNENEKSKQSLDYKGDQKIIKKQCLYEKFLKNKTKTRLETYNHYKTFFEKMLKLVSAMFYQIFIFHHMIALSKL